MKVLFSSLILGWFLLPWSSALAALVVADSMEQRLAACAACHGQYGEGNVQDSQVPRLAEKPAAYLYKQLRSIRAGEGNNLTMEHLIRPLSDDYLKRIAQFYAEQKVAYRAPTVEVEEAILTRGKQLVEEGDLARGVLPCQRCHGEALTGVGQMIPGILNQPADYIYTQLKLWSQGQRSIKSTHCMWVIAKRIIDSDRHAVAAYLASQPLPADRNPISIDQLPEPLPGWCTLEDSGVEW